MLPAQENDGGSADRKRKEQEKGRPEWSRQMDGEPLRKRRAHCWDDYRHTHYECGATSRERHWHLGMRGSLFDMMAYYLGAGSASEDFHSPYWRGLLQAVRTCCPQPVQCAVQYYVGERYCEEYGCWLVYSKVKHNRKYWPLDRRTTTGWLLSEDEVYGLPHGTNPPPRLPPCVVEGFRWLEFPTRAKAEGGPGAAVRWVFASPRYVDENLMLHGTPTSLSLIVRDFCTGKWRERGLLRKFECSLGSRYVVLELVAFWPWPFGFPLPPGADPRRDDSNPDGLAKYKFHIELPNGAVLVATEQAVGMSANNLQEMGIKGLRISVGDLRATTAVLDEILRWLSWLCSTGMNESRSEYPWPARAVDRPLNSPDSNDTKRWDWAAKELEQWCIAVPKRKKEILLALGEISSSSS